MSESQGARGWTPRAIMIGLALVLAWLLYDCTLAVDPALNAIEVLYLIGFAAVFTMFAVQVGNRLVREDRRLTVAELTIIYAMVAVAIPWGILIRGALEAPIKIGIVYTGKTDPTPGFLTGLWVPKSRDAIELFRRGGVMPWDIPWSAWAKPILYWSALLVSFQLFAVFMVLFFRRIFIDEEKLPFPLAQVGQSIIEHRPPPENDAGERKLATAGWIAFGIGLAICAPAIQGITPYSTPSLPMDSSYYGTTTGLIPGTSIALSWDPFVLCFLMFFPTDVLLTVVTTYAGLNILVPVVCGWMGMAKPPVADWTLQVCGMGGLVGLAFWSIFFNRGLIGDFVRRAFGRGPRGRGNEPMGYGVVVWGMVLSFFAFLALFVVGLIDWADPNATGGFVANLHRHLISLAVVVFFLVVMLIAHLRQMGESGWHYHSPWSVGKVLAYAHQHWLIHPGGVLPERLFRTQASFLTISNVIHFAAYQNTFAPHLHVLDSLRVASNTNTSTRDVMKAAFLALAVGIVITVPLYLVVIHYYGFQHGATSSDWYNFWNYSEPQHGIAYGAIPTMLNRFGVWTWVPVLIGASIVGLLMFLKRELIRFPFSPVGFVIAAGLSYFSNYSTPVIWFPMLIVLVVKHVIYKWFGVAFFRRRVIPVVLFAMMGLMTGMFVYKLVVMSLGRGFLRPY